MRYYCSYEKQKVAIVTYFIGSVPNVSPSRITR